MGDLIGLMWYDNSRRDWRERMIAVVERHHQKFGVKPTLCHINPAMVNRSGIGQPEFVERVGDIEVYLNNVIRPDHFFVAKRMQPQAAPPAVRGIDHV